jgi:WXG100 family type VII secretion target
MSPYQKVIKWITPPEAKPIAEKMMQSAQRVRELAKRAKSVEESLQSSWKGKAKDRFSAEYRPLVGDLEKYAALLERRAAAIAAVAVWIEIQEWVEDKLNL